MNEATPFFQSWGFWLLIGIFIGTVFGWFLCSLMVISKRSDMDAEIWELKKENQQLSKELVGLQRKKVFDN